MRLRLGLDLRDLANRFAISVSLAGKIFNSWVLAMAGTLGRLMVFLPDQNTVLACKPQRYRGIKNLQCIVDCTELFIETPKDLQI